MLAAAGDVREQLLDAAADKLEAARDDLELAEGTVRVKGSPEKAVTIADLAGDGTFHGKGSGPLPESPSVDAEGCLGRHGVESFLAPQLITHAVRVRVDRDTGVARVLQVAAAHDSGVILNPIGANGQVYGGVVMGLGPGADRGNPARRGRAPPQPAPARLQADHGVRRAADRHRVGRDRHAECRAARIEGHRRAAVRPDRGRGRECDRKGNRGSGAPAADDAGACLGRRLRGRIQRV